MGFLMDRLYQAVAMKFEFYRNKMNPAKSVINLHGISKTCQWRANIAERFINFHNNLFNFVQLIKGSKASLF